MSEQNHWDDLANQLGAEVKPIQETTEPAAAAPRPAAPSARPKTKPTSPAPRPADWSVLANSLGIEVPAEPVPPPATASPPPRREESFSTRTRGEEPSRPPRRAEPAWAEEIIEDVEVVDELDDEIIPLDSELESEAGDEAAESRGEPTGGREQGDRGESGDRPRRRRRRGRRGRSDRGGESAGEAGRRPGGRPEGRGGEQRSSSGGRRPRADRDQQRHREQPPRDAADEPTVPMDDEEGLSLDRPERSTSEPADRLFSDRPEQLAFDDLFEGDRADRARREAVGRSDPEHEEASWHKAGRAEEDQSDVWGSVDQDDDLEEGELDDSDLQDSELQDSDVESSDVEGRGDSSRSQGEGEGGDKRRRRRRRRRRGGRERSSEGGTTKAGDEASPDDSDEPLADQEPERMGDFNELDDADDDGGVDHHSHRGIPSWDEAIGFIIDSNMEGRSKSSKNGNSRGRRGGRGRSPRRDRDGERPSS